MLQEINEQPKILRQILDLMKEPIYNKIKAIQEKNDIKRIILTGSGDSYCAALTVEDAFSLHGISAYGVPPMALSRYKYKFEHYLDQHTLLVPISVSGHTKRVIEAIHAAKSRKSKILAVTNNPESPVAQLSDDFIYAKSSPIETLQESTYEGELSSKYIGYEHDVPQTKSYTAVQMTLLLMALSFDKDPYYSALKEIPTIVEKIIKNSLIKETGSKYANNKRFVYCASGPNFGNAQFAEFKMFEFAMNGYSKDIEEYCHTVYFITEESTPVMFIAPSGESLQRTSEIAPILKNIIKADSIILSDTKPNFDHNTWIEIPYIGSEEFSIIPYGVVAPLFAFWAAKETGRNVNAFRGGVDHEKYVTGSFHTIRQSEIKNKY